jgi:hypothetical protein
VEKRAGRKTKKRTSDLKKRKHKTKTKAHNEEDRVPFSSSKEMDKNNS